MFLPEAQLKDTIIEILREDEKSISGINRELDKKGIKLHKLVLTGYLRSLADLGVLQEREIPPSKVYSTTASFSKDIYTIIGDAVRAIEDDPREHNKTALYIFQTLFMRPIFLAELLRAGMDEPFGMTNVEGDKRTEARRVLTKSGIKLPNKDPAYYLSEEQTKMSYEKVRLAVLEELALQITSSYRLRKATKQTKLL